MVQKAHFAVRDCKPPTFMHRVRAVSVNLRNSGLPFTVVPCLHQCNLYMERKLRRWKTQKCKPCFSAESPLRRTWTENHLISCIAYRAVSVNLRNSGLPFTVVPCLHQCNLYMERKLRRWKTQKCKPCFGAESPLRRTWTENHLISCIAYRAVSVNLRNSGLPFTVVPCLHQCNLYMERKLRRWRTQKCKPCFGAESPLRSTGLQSTGFHASRMVTSV